MVAQDQARSGPASEDRLECPNCGCRHFDTSHTNGARRRKVCRHCGRPLQTREIPEVLYRRLVEAKEI